MSHGIKHRTATIVLATALMFAWSGAHASWARLSDSQLIETSSLIVVGTLAEFTSATDPSDGRIRTIGVIEIETVLKGDPGTKIVRLDAPQPGRLVSSTDITYQIGQNGLWFLRLLTPESAEIYAADHPQRFVPLANAGPSIEAVRKFLER